VSISTKFGGIIGKCGSSESTARMKRSRTESLGIETNAREEKREFILKIKSKITVVSLEKHN